MKNLNYRNLYEEMTEREKPILISTERKSNISVSVGLRSQPPNSTGRRFSPMVGQLGMFKLWQVEIHQKDDVHRGKVNGLCKNHDKWRFFNLLHEAEIVMGKPYAPATWPR